jgi:steroid delta-isomerase-like uncharacterized protein
MLDAREVWAAMSAADNRHDTSRYADWMSDDVVVHVLGGREVRGLARYRSFMTELFAGIPDYHASPLHVLSADDLVMVHWIITGTHTGTLFGADATGRAVEYTGCSVWRVADGRIVEGWMYPDRAALQAQLTG